MGDQFFETIFLKDDSTQDYELRLMKGNPYANNEEEYMLEMGVAGEKQLMYHLKKSNIGMYALRDINIKHDDFKAQIDFVLITSHHCYFVECKNYNADIIHVDESGNFSLSTRYGKKYNRKGIPSPISQAENQLNVLKKKCLNDQELTKAILSGNKFNDYFKTITVFTNPDNILDLKKAPQDIKYRVLKVDNLIRQIEYDNKHFNGNKLSKDEMKQIADYFLLINQNEKFEKIQQTQTKVITVKNPPQTNHKKNSDAKNDIVALLLEFFGGLVLVFLVCGALLLLPKYLSWISGLNNNTTQSVENNSKDTKGKKLTESQIKAINTLKSGYDSSKANGFEIVHKSVCDEISGMLDNKLSCAGGGFKINMEDNNLSVYHSFTCYRLNISNNNELIDKEIKYVGYDIDKECTGTPIGIIEWDNNNEYFNKIGGYNKLRELSIYAYKNSDLTPYYDYSHISERGGNAQLYATYKMTVDNFFSSVTGKTFYDTTKDKCNEMAKNYYYIMK